MTKPLNTLGRLFAKALRAPPVSNQIRRLNCYGDTSEMQGLVLGVYSRDDEVSGLSRIFTESTEKFDKETGGRLTELLQ
ncbi:unnamed protein product, partial [Nesidiocoris tenuis]